MKFIDHKSISTTLMAVVMSDLHDLPDLVIDRILGFLPTKLAVHATFLSKRHALSSASTLEFDEYEDYNIFEAKHFSSRHKQQHRKFINFLRKYLKYHEKYEKKEGLCRVKLHTSMYLGEDATVIHGWLDRAIHRGLKELDVSPLQRTVINGRIQIEYDMMYRLPWVIFANNNAETLTSLNLEYTRIINIQSAKLQRDRKCLFPSLKTASLSWVWFDNKALDSLLLECPSIKHLSLKQCYFRDFKCRVSSSSLECLELNNCRQLRKLQIHDETKNLESFTYISQDEPYSLYEDVILNKSFKLKNISIYTDNREEFYGYHLPWVTLFSNAKFLTSMTLICTRIANLSANVQSDERVLPSLETLSFSYSWFADQALSSLLSQCPSLEKLSIETCCFENSKCHVSSYSLKSLEVIGCWRLRILQVDDVARSLESFTFVYPPAICEKLILNNTFNLKNICISLKEVGEISLNRYHRILEAKIDVRNLNLFDFLSL